MKIDGFEVVEEDLTWLDYDLETSKHFKAVTAYRADQLMEMVLKKALGMGAIVRDPKTKVYLIDEKNAELALTLPFLNESEYHKEADSCLIPIAEEKKEEACFKCLKEAEFRKYGRDRELEPLNALLCAERDFYEKLRMNQKRIYKFFKARKMLESIREGGITENDKELELVEDIVIRNAMNLDEAKIYISRYAIKRPTALYPVKERSNYMKWFENLVGIKEYKDLEEKAELTGELELIEELRPSLGGPIYWGLVFSAMKDYGIEPPIKTPDEIEKEMDSMSKEALDYNWDDFNWQMYAFDIYKTQREICTKTSPLVANLFALDYYTLRDVLKTARNEKLLNEVKEKTNANEIVSLWQQRIGGDYSRLEAIEREVVVCK